MPRRTGAAGLENAFCVHPQQPCGRGDGGSALLVVMVGGLRLFMCNPNSCDETFPHSRKAKPFIVFSLRESKLQIGAGVILSFNLPLFHFLDRKGSPGP